jgi:predicted metal-dependent peptidase
MGKKLQLPGRFPKRGHKNRLKHLVYALDVSGSINQKQAQQFHESVRTIKELLNPSKLTVLFFDTKIKLERTFTDRESYGNIQVHAGGGTDLQNVYARTKELGPEALVIFTDLCVGIPPKPDWETIWLIPEAYYSVPSNIYGEVYLIPETK